MENVSTSTARKTSARPRTLAETLTVRLGNVYVGNLTLRVALRRLFTQRPEVVVINEGRRVRRLFVRGLRPGYRMHVSATGSDRGRTDVLVLVRRSLKRIGPRRASVLLSKARAAFGPANHDRWAVIACFWHAGTKYAVIGIHPSPGPKALAGDGSHPIAVQYADAMDRLAVEIDRLRTDGFRVIVAGDIQIRASNADQSFDPRVVLPAHGLKVVADEHFDIIAVDKALRVTDSRILAPADHTPRDGAGTGADHPFLTVTVMPEVRS